MMRRLTRFVRDACGNTAVEFALVAPMLVFMTLALWEFGNAVNERTQLETAARAGAQAAMSDSTDTAAIEQAVYDATGLTSTDLTITTTTACECSDGTSVDCTTGTCAVGSVQTYMTVQVTKPYTLTVNSDVLNGVITLTGRATLRVE